MGFHTGKHGKVYNDDKPTHGSPGSNPGNNDGSSSTYRDDDKDDVYSYDEAPQELKDKIIEKLREREYEYGSDWFADYDGAIYDQKTQIADYDVFDNYSKKYYDLDRGQYIQFPDLEVKDDKMFAKMVGINEALRQKVAFNFESENTDNTKLTFFDERTGDEIDFRNNMDYEDYKKYSYGDKDTILSKKEFEALDKASEKWDDLMHEAWKGLRDNYEYQFTDEALKERAISNEYDFDENGDIV